jgi:3-methyl-2-oxobutanoate hydroxymethyltransferase
MNAVQFRQRKVEGPKLSVTTCYDYWSARILRETPVDAILVGDSAAMVMHGYASTLPATIELMARHTEAVARGAPDKFLIGDMPFLSFRKGLAPAIDAVGTLVRAGAQAIKIEGIEGHEDLIAHIVESGVPVMGHIGLTPQAVNQIGGFKVQGVGEDAAGRLIDQARRLESAGCFAMVLECVPMHAAKRITETVAIPTIGIGAGPHCDGQVLVLHDLAGFNREFHPKFVKAFEDGFELIRRAVEAFDRETKDGSFPTDAQSYS